MILLKMLGKEQAIREVCTIKLIYLVTIIMYTHHYWHVALGAHAITCTTSDA